MIHGITLKSLLKSNSDIPLKNCFICFKENHLTLIWVGFFGVYYEVGGGGRGKITPCLKLVWYVSTHTYVVSENIQYQGSLNFFDASIFYAKNQHFLTKKVTLLKAIVWELLGLFLLVLFSVFVRQKVTVNANVSFTDYASGIRFPNCSKLAKNRKSDYDVTISWHGVIVKLFGSCFVSLVKFF